MAITLDAIRGERKSGCNLTGGRISNSTLHSVRYVCIGDIVLSIADCQEENNKNSVLLHLKSFVLTLSQSRYRYRYNFRYETMIFWRTTRNQL